jgi:molybdate transport system substrate-binding protein
MTTTRTSSPRLRPIRTGALALACVAALALAGCSSDDSGDGGKKELTVLAAASLTDTFTEMGTQFEKEHSGVEVTFSFGSSGTLADQVLEGGPGDVLATADEATMERASDELAEGSDVFASNRLVLVTPADNPAKITSLADLDNPDVDYVVCVDTAPCGAISARTLEAADIGNEPVSLEIDVKAVLARVTSGEVDAGLVYVTDAVAAGDAVTAIDLPAEFTETTLYPIAALEQSEEPDLAQEFVDFVLSTNGQEALSSAGFGTP